MSQNMCIGAKYSSGTLFCGTPKMRFIVIPNALPQVCIMIHSGSRGLGHQVATDALVLMEAAMARDKIHINDRQLACAKINSQVACGGQAFIDTSSCGILLIVTLPAYVPCFEFQFVIHVLSHRCRSVRFSIITVVHFGVDFPVRVSEDGILRSI